MISAPLGVRVYLACGTTDMRKGMDGLAMVVQQVLAEDPFGGAVYAFRGRRGQRPTFCIQFTFCDDRLSMASADGAHIPGLTSSSRQGPEVRLY